MLRPAGGEWNYDAGLDAPKPPLDALAGVAGLAAPESQHIEAAYFDTASLALAGRGIALHRQAGGEGAGWHLELPSGPGGHREVSEPVGPDGEGVPEALRRLVRAHVRDAPLLSVAQVATERSSIALLGADASVLARFCDDRIESRPLLGEAPPLVWREWALQCVGSGGALAEAAGDLLRAHGAVPAAHRPQLSRVLPGLPPRPAQPAQPRRAGPAWAVLVHYLWVQLEALKEMDRAVREGEAEGVHKFRVAARRMRSALATYAALVDAGTAEQLRGELRWVAGEVGAARDLEVMRQRFSALLSAEAPGSPMGQVTKLIDEELGSRQRAALARGLAALDNPRYFRLLDALDAFVSHPPLEAVAARKAAKVTPRCLCRDLDRLRRAVAAAEEAAGTAGDDQILHEVRKRAKRLRYAAESADGVLGRRAGLLAGEAARIQETLGEHHDTVVSRALLSDLGNDASARPADSFALGRLDAQEELRGAEARERFFRQWSRFVSGPLPCA